MKTLSHENKKSNLPAATHTDMQKKNTEQILSPYIDNRPEALVQKKVQAVINNSYNVSLPTFSTKTVSHSAAIQLKNTIQLKKWKALKQEDIDELVTSLKQYIQIGLAKVDIDTAEMQETENNIATLTAVLNEKGIDEETPLAREALAKAAGYTLSKPKIHIEKFVIASMKRNAFAAILTGKLGCVSLGKDGQNHDIYQNSQTGKTTSLGIGGHGNVTQDEGVLKTYLNQLGISASEWNNANN